MSDSIELSLTKESKAQIASKPLIEENTTHLIASKEKLNLTLFLLAKTLSLLGSNVYNFALSLYILKITGSGLSFALNVMIGFVPKILLGPIAGVIADRVDRKKVAVMLDAASSAVVFGLLGFWVFAGFKVGIIYLASLLLSLISVFYDTVINASIPKLVSDKSLVKINTFTHISISLSGILGPVLGGLAYGLISIEVFLMVNAISFLISATCALFMNFSLNERKQTKIPAEAQESPESNTSKKHFFRDLKEILFFVGQQKLLVTIFKYSLLINFVLMASISVIFPYTINTFLKMTSEQYGFFQACFSFGILVASIVYASKKGKTKNAAGIATGIAGLGVCVGLSGLPTLFAGSARQWLVPYYMLLLLAIGIFMVIANTPIMVGIQRLTPGHMLGRIMGVLGTLTGGIAPIGILLAGLLIDKVHPFILLAVSGAFTALMAVLLFFNKQFTEKAFDAAIEANRPTE